MLRTAIFLGIALTLGAFPPSSVGQTPASPAQNSTATAQNPTENSATPEKAPDADHSTAKPERKWRVRLGTISLGAGYSRFGGPFYSPFYSPYGAYSYDGFYRAGLWDPYWAAPFSYADGYFGYNDGRGEVKLSLEPKAFEAKLAEVYVDNAYAGTADRLKSMWLEPGAYDLSVSSKDHGTYRRRIYVLSGRSLKISAKLDPQNAAASTEAKP